MSDHRYDVDRDLREAEAMAKALETYLKGDALYGSVGGGGFLSLSPMPSLTVGALLLRLRRLGSLDNADKLDAKGRERLRKISHQHQTIRDQNRKAYQAKLRREAESRLKAMSQFFEECFNDPKSCARNYRPEADRRTIVQEIIIAMDAAGISVDDDLKKLISTTDAKLRRYANEQNGFILDLALESLYPADKFWWLHQEPHTPEK